MVTNPDPVSVPPTEASTMDATPPVDGIIITKTDLPVENTNTPPIETTTDTDEVSSTAAIILTNQTTVATTTELVTTEVSSTADIQTTVATTELAGNPLTNEIVTPGNTSVMPSEGVTNGKYCYKLAITERWPVYANLNTR